MASPINLSRVPSTANTEFVVNVKYWFKIDTTSSGSNPSDKGVNPLISTNKQAICLFSPPTFTL